MAWPRKEREQMQAKLAPMPMRCRGGSPTYTGRKGWGSRQVVPLHRPPAPTTSPEGTMQAHKVVS